MNEDIFARVKNVYRGVVPIAREVRERDLRVTLEREQRIYPFTRLCVSRYESMSAATAILPISLTLQTIALLTPAH